MESRSRSFDLRKSINPQRQHRGAAQVLTRSLAQAALVSKMGLVYDFIPVESDGQCTENGVGIYMLFILYISRNTEIASSPPSAFANNSSTASTRDTPGQPMATSVGNPRSSPNYADRQALPRQADCS